MRGPTGSEGDPGCMFMTHTKQLLLVKFCDTTTGIWVIFRTGGRRNMEDGRTDRRGSWNSYLDKYKS